MPKYLLSVNSICLLCCLVRHKNRMKDAWVVFFFEAKSVKVLGLIIYQYPYGGPSKWIRTPGVFPCRPKMGWSLKTSWPCWADSPIHPMLLINLSFKTFAVTAAPFFFKAKILQRKSHAYINELNIRTCSCMHRQAFSFLCDILLYVLYVSLRRQKENDKFTRAGVLVWILICHLKYIRV